MSEQLLAVGSGGSGGSGGSLGVLIGEVRDWFGKYIYVMNPRDLDVIALWAIHT